jgi:hypothetical protein
MFFINAFNTEFYYIKILIKIFLLKKKYIIQDFKKSRRQKFLLDHMTGSVNDLKILFSSKNLLKKIIQREPYQKH